MNVRELKQFLDRYPEEMEVLNERYSDYAIVSEEDFSVIEGVGQGGWVMRTHPTMSFDNLSRKTEFLLLKGN